jgi:cation transporter-like permease
MISKKKSTRPRPIKRFVSDVKVLHKQPHRHWHYVYRHRRARLLTDDVNTWQIVAGQVFTVIASVFAGLILDIQKENIGLLIGAFVVMPGIIDLSASLTGAMAAKINHHIDETPAHPVSIAIHDVGFALFVGSFAGLIVGLFGGLLSELFFEGDIWKLTVLGMASMTTVSLLGNPFIALLTIVFKKLRMNPDNIVGPIQSSLIDMLAVMVIATYARVLT